ncbi:cytochrome P450 family protein [Aspergillus sclerotiicarbonarius CBS 121057]|uniref:Cytochrome P450 family protein n=1 Tax=Aspergillus sclerotiicarbonarius (strain CBS 121057 / IBT 28362) TaxID=1448318 RepID=A0A319F6Z0_ASPSB|nr:cytochrome P450 family protein [Aspergillus sclerotiicarbonarius CBS 121057]
MNVLPNLSPEIPSHDSTTPIIHFLTIPTSLLSLSLLFYILYTRFLNPISRIPGPFWASISRLWLVRRSDKGHMHREFIDLHTKYGKLVRIAPNEVSVADLDAILKIYGAGTKFMKSDWYSVWQGHRTFDLFAERNEIIHGAQRRLVNNVYSMSSLKDFESGVDSVVERFMQCMVRLGSETTVDMGKWMQLFAFDVIGEITFSKTFGFLENGTDGGAFQQIENALRSASWVGQVPWLYWVHDYLTPIIGSHLAITARHGTIRQIAAREVTSRKEGKQHPGEKRDLLAKLFDVQNKKDKQMSDNDVLSMAASNVFAGSDTTAISLRSIIYYLLKSHECLSKLRDEIEDRKCQGRLSDPVRLEEANDMPYLQACMYEALRLHPAVGMNLPRVVPKEGIVIDGCFLPGGTTVGVNPWVVHRDPSVFGDDVEAFRPERWLAEKTGDMKRYFFAFGGGARLCIGKNISWMEMSKMIPTLLNRFEIQLAEPDANWKETCWWFVKQEGVMVKLRPRS